MDLDDDQLDGKVSGCPVICVQKEQILREDTTLWSTSTGGDGGDT